MAGEALRILNGAGAGTQIPLQGDFVVGRSETGMGNLAGDSEISRRHARFQQDSYGRVIVEDLGSTNGTHVNGQRLSAPHVLAPGDQITLGKTVLQFDAGAAAQATSVGAVVPPAAAAVPAAAAAVPPAAAAVPPVAAPPPPPPSSRPRWLPIAAIVGAVLIIGGVVAAVIASSGSDDKPPKPAIQTVPTQTTPTTTTPAETTPPPAPRPTVRSVSGLEAGIKSVLKSKTGPSPKSVSCPSGAPAARGSKFVCQLGGPGITGTVKITLRDNLRRAYKFKAVIFGNGFKRTVTGTVS